MKFGSYTCMCVQILSSSFGIAFITGFKPPQINNAPGTITQKVLNMAAHYLPAKNPFDQPLTYSVQIQMMSKKLKKTGGIK